MAYFRFLSSLPGLILTGILLFFAAQLPASAGAWTLPKGEIFAKAYVGTSSAESYLDSDGNSITTLETERTYGEAPFDTTERRLVDFSFQQIVAGLYAEYGITDKLTLVADIPFGIFSLDEESDATRVNLDEENNLDTLRAQLDETFTLSSPVYLGIGARYRIIQREKLVASLSALLRIPPGFSDGIVDNPDYDFLSDGAFEALFGLELGAPTTYGWIGASARYNKRAEDYEDEILLHFEIGFNNIPQAAFKINLDLTQSVASMTDARPFNIRETQLQSNFFAAGAAFSLFLNEHWFIDANYSVRIFGENTWSLNTFVLGGGLRM